MNSVVPAIVGLVFAQQALKTGISLRILTLFQKNLQVLVQSLTIHAANFQNSRSVTGADLLNEAWIVSSKPRPNLTIPSDQFRIDIFLVAQRFSLQPATLLPAGLHHDLLDLPPNAIVPSNPSFILAYIKAHLP